MEDPLLASEGPRPVPFVQLIARKEYYRLPGYFSHLFMSGPKLIGKSALVDAFLKAGIRLQINLMKLLVVELLMKPIHAFRQRDLELSLLFIRSAGSG